MSATAEAEAPPLPAAAVAAAATKGGDAADATAPPPAPPHLSSDADLLVAGLTIADAGTSSSGTSSSGTSGAAGAVQRRAFVATDADAAAADAQLRALGLTPEQDAAAERLAAEFVELYEEAFLSRAVRRVAEACGAQEGQLPEAAVAAKLRRRGVDLGQLQARAAEVARGIAECESDEGWRLVSDDGTMRLLYRHDAARPTVHCFKGVCLLPAPVEQPLAMAREFDLVKTWNSYITHSTVLRTFSDIDLLVYASVWMPWPLAQRDVLISAVADDELRERGVLAVSFASPHETPPGVEPDLPPGAAERVRVFFTEGSCMTMAPLPPADGEGSSSCAAATAAGADGAGVPPSSSSSSSPSQRTRVTVVSNIDTKLSSVPETVIQFVLRIFAPFMMSSVLKVLHSAFDDPRGALATRMREEHAELYAMMRERVAHFLAGRPD